MLDYGARPDGGTVFVSAGTYVTGPIELVSNLVLHIDATLRLPADPTELTYGKGRLEGKPSLRSR